MKLNDQARFTRELQGDFSEIDTYMRGQYVKMAAFALGLIALLVLNWMLP